MLPLKPLAWRRRLEARLFAERFARWCESMMLAVKR